MRRRLAIPLLVSIAAALATVSPASAKPQPVGSGDGGFALTPVGSFDRPIHAENAPGTKGALYVVESEGVIRVLLGTAFDGVSVIAGFVVRDERLRGQYGRLIYTDASNPQIRSLIPSQASAADDQATGLSVTGNAFSFAEGFRNHLFVISGGGQVYRLDPA